jgi:segregation and condensation protein B
MEEQHKNKVEAVLFTTGRFLTVEEIAKLSEIGSVGVIKNILEQLKKDYETRKSALNILSEENKWKLGIKKEYLYLTEKLLTDCELDKPVQETLAVIAYKQPVLQCDIVKVRGNTCYEHIKLLRDNGFVTSEKSGRTRILKLTGKFYDYFDVVADTLKAKLNSCEVKQNEEK